MAELHICPFEREDIPAVKAFTDRAIGQDYNSLAEVTDMFERSQLNGVNCSLLLKDDQGEVHAVRITYPPGRWNQGKAKGLNPSLWRVPMSEAAYFQSLFVGPGLTGQGWGKKLSLASLKILQGLGTRAVVCHSWKESPNDSSGHYLRSMGFEFVASHPLYWKDVDYTCTRCGKPCTCTAEEMIKYL